MSLIPFSTPAPFYKVIRSVSMSFQSLNACGVPMASRLDAAVKDGGRGRWCCVLSLPSVRPSLNSRNSPIESLASQKNEKFFVTFVWISSVKYVRSPCFFFCSCFRYRIANETFFLWGLEVTKSFQQLLTVVTASFRLGFMTSFAMRVGGRLRRSVMMCSFSFFSVRVLSCHRPSTVEEEE